MNANLYQQMLDRTGDGSSIAIRAAGGGSLTYEELFRRSGLTAGALAASGVVQGDRVVAQVEKSVEALLLYLACLRLGAVYLPLNVAYTLAELEYFIRDAQPRLVVCDPARQEGIAVIANASGAVVLTLGKGGKGTLPDRVNATSVAHPVAVLGEDDLAAILYTSGTTGRSKGAMLTHGNLASNALILIDCWRFTPDDVLIHALPIYHAHGLFVGCNVTFLSAASMHFCSRFDPAEVLRLMPIATVMMGVPTFYTRLLADPGLTADAARHVRLFISGSAPLLAETHVAWRARTGHPILERYGMTETGMNTSNPYMGDRIAGTVGFPLPGVELRVVGAETGLPVAANEIGMIEVRGPNVFKGYWRMPEKTAAEIKSDGFFITGDLGKVDEAGYVHIVGRGKDLIITGGFNVYPKEVEAEIDAVPGVVESAVIGIPHPDFGEAVTVVVVRQDDASVDEHAIAAALAKKLARFKLPKRILFVSELPRNAMGKVQKSVLRKTSEELYLVEL